MLQILIQTKRIFSILKHIEKNSIFDLQFGYRYHKTAGAGTHLTRAVCISLFLTLLNTRFRQSPLYRIQFMYLFISKKFLSLKYYFNQKPI